MVDVREYLPHRYPFLFIDHFISLEDNHFEAVKNVSYNEPFFQGHFPSEPVMPGVLILEALAQATAIAVMIKFGLPPGTIGYITAFDKVKFRRKVVPGDILRLSGDILYFRRGLGKATTTAQVGDELAVESSGSLYVPQ